MFEQTDRKIKIHCSQEAYNCMKPFLYDELVEHFYIMLLDRNNQVLKFQKISSGGTNATLADPKLIFKNHYSINRGFVKDTSSQFTQKRYEGWVAENNLG